MELDRNQILNKILRGIANNEMKDTMKKVEEIERVKGNSMNLYNAVIFIKNNKTKQNILIETEDGSLTTNEDEQAKHITNFFKDFFNNKNIELFEHVEPT